MENQYEEISLKELFEVIWKGKFIIAGVTLVFLLVGLLYTNFFVDEKYEATTTLTVNEVYFTPNSKNYYPTYNAASATEILSSNKFALEVIEDHNLINSDGDYISADQLLDCISVKTNENGQIRIDVKLTSKDKTNTVAKEIIKTFNEHVIYSIQSTSNETYNQLSNVLVSQKEELNIAQSNYLEYLNTNQNIHVIKNEREKILDSLKSYNNQLVTLNTSIEVYLNTLSVLNDSFDLSNVITTEISAIISSGNYTGDLINIEDNASEELIAIKASEFVVQLTFEMSRRDVYESEIINLEESLLELEETILELETGYEAVVLELTTAENNYSSTLSRVEDALRLKVWDDEERVILYSDTVEANGPVSPNKILNSAVSVVLGGFIGVMVVFIKKYWME
ncbi:Wzz/FepE/Etk N-terminal domain-containing protein [Mycoplasmatota bacterium zrk1]